MKISQIILFVIILFILSCKQDEIITLGSCYIQENKSVKYLDKTLTGDVDTILLDYANAENFHIISDLTSVNECLNLDVWAKDKLSVWYKHFKIIGADPSSFQLSKNAYAFDKMNVFYKQWILANADKKSFEILSNFFAKDNEHIWYKGKEVFGIENPSDFVVIDGYFSSDGNRIFLNNDTIVLKIPDSDVNTFISIQNDKHLSSLKYYKDKKNVYCIDTEKNVGEADFMYVFDAFTKSFEILNNKYYSKDNFNVYYKNKIVEYADRLTFEPFGSNYSKDSINIFFKHKIMEGVDYKSFKLIESDSMDAKDSFNHFYKGKKVQNNNSTI